MGLGSFFNISKAEDMSKAADESAWGSAISLIPSFSFDDFKSALEGMSLGMALLTVAAIFGPLLIVALNVIGHAFSFVTGPIKRNIASTQVLESLNSNIVNTPFRAKANRPYELDTDKLLAKNTFAIKPADLIKRCKDVLDKGFSKVSQGIIGLAAEDIAEDFVCHFGPTIQLNKEEYLHAVQQMKIRDAFPDFTPNFCNFQHDPVLTNRVWMIGFPRGVHTGKETPLFGKPTNVSVCLPPIMFGMTFNAAGSVVCLSGAPIDLTQGTTDGVGSTPIYGLLWGIGRPLPFPEAQPFKKSTRLGIFQRIHALKASISNVLGKDKGTSAFFLPLLE